MKTKLLTVMLFCTSIIGISCKGQEQSEAPATFQQKPRNGELRRLLATAFARWDSNHDGRLTLPEIIAVMENPQTTPDQAAAAMVVQHSLDIKKGGNPAKSLSLADVLALASQRKSEKSFKRIRRNLASVSRELFLPGEPNIEEIHQGPVGIVIC